MKKIIMFVCIISLTCFASSDVSAATDLDYVLDAMSKTLDKAKSEATGIEISTSIIESVKADSYKPEGVIPNSIVSKLSTMRAQAELYYNDKNSYGTRTLSCSTGLFGNSENGLGYLVAEIKGYTKDINCRSTPTSYAVTVKIAPGEYWCIDSTGESKAVTKHLKKGAVSCAAGANVLSKTKKVTTSILQTIFPINGGYQIKQISSTDESGQSYSVIRILKDGITYMLIHKGLEQSSGQGIAQYIGRYLTITNNNSYIGQLLSLSNSNVDKYIEIVSNPAVTKAKFVKNNPDGSTIYNVGVSRVEISGLLLKKTPVTKNVNDLLTFEVKIKDGIIVSISNTSSLPTGVMYTKGRLTGTTLELIPEQLKISCAEFVGQAEAKDVCEPMENSVR